VAPCWCWTRPRALVFLACFVVVARTFCARVTYSHGWTGFSCLIVTPQVRACSVVHVVSSIRVVEPQVDGGERVVGPQRDGQLVRAVSTDPRPAQVQGGELRVVGLDASTTRAPPLST
jgi:hypothetical protein